ncbi:hypothetical protein AYI69_g4607 [Smittium culicis]|uniref:Uncharacterized protein n=1 Tax=Smittium culicis TaxID=133412 RepID=A0A1R1YC62_9FUNG|nr:hypothetical protein AYI69_g4607 [Smittium culicis]
MDIKDFKKIENTIPLYLGNNNKTDDIIDLQNINNNKECSRFRKKPIKRKIKAQNKDDIDQYNQEFIVDKDLVLYDYNISSERNDILEKIKLNYIYNEDAHYQDNRENNEKLESVKFKPQINLSSNKDFENFRLDNGAVLNNGNGEYLSDENIEIYLEKGSRKEKNDYHFKNESNKVSAPSNSNDYLFLDQEKYSAKKKDIKYKFDNINPENEFFPTKKTEYSKKKCHIKRPINERKYLSEEIIDRKEKIITSKKNSLGEPFYKKLELNSSENYDIDYIYTAVDSANKFDSEKNNHASKEGNKSITRLKKGDINLNSEINPQISSKLYPEIEYDYHNENLDHNSYTKHKKQDKILSEDLPLISSMKSSADTFERNNSNKEKIHELDTLPTKTGLYGKYDNLNLLASKGVSPDNYSSNFNSGGVVAGKSNHKTQIIKGVEIIKPMSDATAVNSDIKEKYKYYAKTKDDVSMKTKEKSIYNTQITSDIFNFENKAYATKIKDQEKIQFSAHQNIISSISGDRENGVLTSGISQKNSIKSDYYIKYFIHKVYINKHGEKISKEKENSISETPKTYFISDDKIVEDTTKTLYATDIRESTSIDSDVIEIFDRYSINYSKESTSSDKYDVAEIEGYETKNSGYADQAYSENISAEEEPLIEIGNIFNIITQPNITEPSEIEKGVYIETKTYVKEKISTIYSSKNGTILSVYSESTNISNEGYKKKLIDTTSETENKVKSEDTNKTIVISSNQNKVNNKGYILSNNIKKFYINKNGIATRNVDVNFDKVFQTRTISNSENNQLFSGHVYESFTSRLKKEDIRFTEKKYKSKTDFSTTNNNHENLYRQREYNTLEDVSVNSVGYNETDELYEKYYTKFYTSKISNVLSNSPVLSRDIIPKDVENRNMQPNLYNKKYDYKLANKDENKENDRFDKSIIGIIDLEGDKTTNYLSEIETTLLPTSSKDMIESGGFFVTYFTQQIYFNDNGETVTVKIDDIDISKFQTAQTSVSKNTDGYFADFYETDTRYLIPKTIENSENKNYFESSYYSAEKEIDNKTREDRSDNLKEYFDHPSLDEKSIYLHDENLYSDVNNSKTKNIQLSTPMPLIKQNEFVEENKITNPSSSYWEQKTPSIGNRVKVNNVDSEVVTLDGISDLIQLEESLESTDFSSTQDDEGFYLSYYIEKVFVNEDGEIITLTINEIGGDLLETYSTINSEYLYEEYSRYRPSRDNEIHLETECYENNTYISEDLASTSNSLNEVENFTEKVADGENDLNTLFTHRAGNNPKNIITTSTKTKLQKNLAYSSVSSNIKLDYTDYSETLTMQEDDYENKIQADKSGYHGSNNGKKTMIVDNRSQFEDFSTVLKNEASIFKNDQISLKNDKYFTSFYNQKAYANRDGDVATEKLKETIKETHKFQSIGTTKTTNEYTASLLSDTAYHSVAENKQVSKSYFNYDMKRYSAVNHDKNKYGHGKMGFFSSGYKNLDMTKDQEYQLDEYDKDFESYQSTIEYIQYNTRIFFLNSNNKLKEFDSNYISGDLSEEFSYTGIDTNDSEATEDNFTESSTVESETYGVDRVDDYSRFSKLSESKMDSHNKKISTSAYNENQKYMTKNKLYVYSSGFQDTSSELIKFFSLGEKSSISAGIDKIGSDYTEFYKKYTGTTKEEFFNEKATTLDVISAPANKKIFSDNDLYSTSILYNKMPSSYIEHGVKEMHEKTFEAHLLNSRFIESEAIRTNKNSKKETSNEINELNIFKQYTVEKFNNIYSKTDIQTLDTVEEPPKVKYLLNGKVDYTRPKYQIYSRTIYLSHKTANFDLGVGRKSSESDFSKKTNLGSSFEPAYNSKSKNYENGSDKKPKNSLEIHGSTSAIIQISHTVLVIPTSEAPPHQILDQTKSFGSLFENQNSSEISAKLPNKNIEHSEESSNVDYYEQKLHSFGYMTRTVIYDEMNANFPGKKSSAFISSRLSDDKIDNSNSDISFKKEELNIKSGENKGSPLNALNSYDINVSIKGGTLRSSSYNAKFNLKASLEAKSDVNLSKSVPYVNKVFNDISEIKHDPRIESLTFNMSRNITPTINSASIYDVVDVTISGSFGSMHSLNDIIYTYDSVDISSSDLSEIGISDSSKKISNAFRATVPSNNEESGSEEKPDKFFESRIQIKSSKSMSNMHAYPSRKVVFVTRTDKVITNSSNYKSGSFSAAYIKTTSESPSMSHTPTISEMVIYKNSRGLKYSTGYSNSIKKITTARINKTTSGGKFSDGDNISSNLLSSRPYTRTIGVTEKRSLISTKFTISPTTTIKIGIQVGSKTMITARKLSVTDSILNNSAMFRLKLEEAKKIGTKQLESIKTPKLTTTAKKYWGAGASKKQAGSNTSAAKSSKGVGKSSTANKETSKPKLGNLRSTSSTRRISVMSSDIDRGVRKMDELDAARNSDHVKGGDATSQRTKYTNTARSGEYMTKTGSMAEASASRSLSALLGSTTSKNGDTFGRSKLHGEINSNSLVTRHTGFAYNNVFTAINRGISGANLGGNEKRKGAIQSQKYLIKDGIEKPIELDPIGGKYLTVVANPITESRTRDRYRNEYNVGYSYYQKNKWVMTESSGRNARTSAINPQYYKHVQSEKNVIVDKESTKTTVNAKSPIISTYHTRQANHGNYNSNKYYYYGETTSQASDDIGQISTVRNDVLIYSQAAVPGRQKSSYQEQRLGEVPIYNYEGIEEPATDTGSQNYNDQVYQFENYARYPGHVLNGDRRYSADRAAEYPIAQTQYTNRGIRVPARNEQPGQTRNKYGYNQHPDPQLGDDRDAYKHNRTYPTKTAVRFGHGGGYKRASDDMEFSKIGSISQQHQTAIFGDDAIYFDHRYGWVNPKTVSGRGGMEHSISMQRAEPERAATRNPQKYAEAGHRWAYQHAQQRNSGNTETMAANFGNLGRYTLKVAESSNNLERPNYRDLGNSGHGVSSNNNRNLSGNYGDKHAPIDDRYVLTPTRTMSINGSRPLKYFEHEYAYSTNNSKANRLISQSTSTAGPNNNLKILFKVIRHSDKKQGDAGATRLVDNYNHIAGKLVDGNRRVTISVGGRPYTKKWA